ncbi:hypothetical protein P9112_009851 [Eukaryota sp. TZLM1-RC]
MAFLSRLFTVPNRHSISYFESLCVNFDKECSKPTIDSKRISELLKEISDLLLWSDRTESSFFQCFLEHGILQRLIQLPDLLPNDIPSQSQLLQSISILVSNLTSTDAIYYLLSNNAISSIIQHPTFSYHYLSQNEEILAYYIALVKSIALRLDVSTLQFFFDPDVPECKLYTSTVNFYDHHEPHIRLAVRTLCLSLLRLNYEPFIEFVKLQDEGRLPRVPATSLGQNVTSSAQNNGEMSPFVLDIEVENEFSYFKNAASRPFFENIIKTITNGWHATAGRLEELSLTSDTCQMTSKDHEGFKTGVSESFDYLLFLNDVFGLGISSISDLLLSYMKVPLDFIVEKLSTESINFSFLLLFLQFLVAIPRNFEFFDEVLIAIKSIKVNEVSLIDRLLTVDSFGENLSFVLLILVLISRVSSNYSKKALSIIFDCDDESQLLSDLSSRMFDLVDRDNIPPIILHLGLRCVSLLTSLDFFPEELKEEILPKFTQLFSKISSNLGSEFIKIYSNPSIKPGHFFASYCTINSQVEAVPFSLDSLLADGNFFFIELINKSPSFSEKLGINFKFMEHVETEDSLANLNPLMYKFHVCKKMCDKLDLLSKVQKNTCSRLESCILPPNGLRVNASLDEPKFSTFQSITCAVQFDDDVLPTRGTLTFHPNFTHIAVTTKATQSDPVNNQSNHVIKRVFPVLFVKASILRHDPTTLHLSAVETLPNRISPCRLSFACYEDTRSCLAEVRKVHCDLLLTLKHDACLLLDVELPTNAVTSRTVRSRSINSK